MLQSAEHSEMIVGPGGKQKEWKGGLGEEMGEGVVDDVKKEAERGHWAAEKGEVNKKLCLQNWAL